MIKTDEVAERAARDADSPFAVPIDLFIPEDGEKILTVIPSLRSLSARLISADGPGPFAEATSEADGYMSKLGFTGRPVVFDQTEYVFGGVSELREGSVVLDGGEPSASVYSDGERVSYASVNDLPGVSEIFVETDEKYRGRGYASACVAALARFLFSQGKKAAYVCDTENVPSMKVAGKAGFIRTGRRLTAVWYRY